jgi:hypothetical protein
MPSWTPFIQPTLEPTFFSPRTFDQNSRVKALENDKIIFEFVDLEPADGNVNLTFFHKGDNSRFGSYALKWNVFTLGESESGEFLAFTEYVVSTDRGRPDF